MCWQGEYHTISGVSVNKMVAVVVMVEMMAVVGNGDTWAQVEGHAGILA